MYETPNLGLTVWDQDSDPFEHTQIVDNWLALDLHDHSTGRGRQIPTDGIRDAAVTQRKLAEAAVGNPQIQVNAVGTDDIQDGAVTAAKLAKGAVTSDAIADGAITASKLESHLIPLGQVVLWWRPPGSNATPGGFWEAMDGRAWSSISNAWNLTSGNIPDTRGAFAKGADVLAAQGPGIGVTGGQTTINLDHTHGLNNHAHSLSNHAHGISSDGVHYHTFFNGLGLWTRANAVPVGPTHFEDTQGTSWPNTRYTLFIKNLLSRVPVPNDPSFDVQQFHNAVQGDYVYDDPGFNFFEMRAAMDPVGAHTHGGVTAAAGGGLTGGSTAATTGANWASNAHDLDPLNVGLLYIMRCR